MSDTKKIKEDGVKEESTGPPVKTSPEQKPDGTRSIDPDRASKDRRKP